MSGARERPARRRSSSRSPCSRARRRARGRTPSLLATSPAASRIAPHGIDAVALTFSEAVEPRFAAISITDRRAARSATGAPERSPANPRTIDALRCSGCGPGWYLVYWRVVSADGHPGARRVHVRDRPRAGDADAVRGPVAARDRRDAGAARRAMGRVPRAHGRDRPVPVPRRHRAAGRARPRRTGRCGRSRSRCFVADRRRPRARPGLPAARRRRSSRRRSALDIGAPAAALAPLVVRPRDQRPRGPARALRRRGRRSPSGSTAPTGRSARSSSCSRGGAAAVCAAAMLARPRPGRPPGADLAARARARARLGAPRGRLGVARRPDRPARAVERGAPRAADARARDRRAAVLAAWRSARC